MWVGENHKKLRMASRRSAPRNTAQSSSEDTQEQCSVGEVR